MYMSFEEFSKRFDNKFKVGTDLYQSLIETVIDNPRRYTGPYRVSSAKTKLIQNLTQSQEIKFGDFMEYLITDYIGLLGYNNLDKKIGVDQDGDALETDQLFFMDQSSITLIEQKIRDDHDSTKKRGQFSNFEKKVLLLKKKYPTKHITGIMWFIDDGLRKNKNYYKSEMNRLQIQNTSLKLYYGPELFIEYFSNSEVWQEILSHLRKNKKLRPNEVLQIPDFDTSEEMFHALKSLPATYKNKLLSDRPEIVELRNELFPTSQNIRKLQEYLKNINEGK